MRITAGLWSGGRSRIFTVKRNRWTGEKFKSKELTIPRLSAASEISKRQRNTAATMPFASICSSCEGSAWNVIFMPIPLWGWLKQGPSWPCYREPGDAKAVMMSSEVSGRGYREVTELFLKYRWGKIPENLRATQQATNRRLNDHNYEEMWCKDNLEAVQSRLTYREIDYSFSRVMIIFFQQGDTSHILQPSGIN